MTNIVTRSYVYTHSVNTHFFSLGVHIRYESVVRHRPLFKVIALNIFNNNK